MSSSQPNGQSMDDTEEGELPEVQRFVIEVARGARKLHTVRPRRKDKSLRWTVIVNGYKQTVDCSVCWRDIAGMERLVQLPAQGGRFGGEADIPEDTSLSWHAPLLWDPFDAASAMLEFVLDNRFSYFRGKQIEIVVASISDADPTVEAFRDIESRIKKKAWEDEWERHRHVLASHRDELLSAYEQSIFLVAHMKSAENSFKQEAMAAETANCKLQTELNVEAMQEAQFRASEERAATNHRNSLELLEELQAEVSRKKAEKQQRDKSFKQERKDVCQKTSEEEEEKGEDLSFSAISADILEQNALFEEEEAEDEGAQKPLDDQTHKVDAQGWQVVDEVDEGDTGRRSEFNKQEAQRQAARIEQLTKVKDLLQSSDDEAIGVEMLLQVVEQRQASQAEAMQSKIALISKLEAELSADRKAGKAMESSAAEEPKNDALRSELQEAQAALKESDALSSMEKRVLKSEMSEAAATQAVAEEHFAKAETEISRQRKEADSLKESLESLEGTCEDEQHRCVELRAASLEDAERIKAMELSSSEEHAQGLAMTSEACQKLGAAEEAAQADKQCHEEVLSTWEQRCQQLNGAASEAQKQNIELKQELDEAHAQLEASADERELLQRQQVTMLETQLAKLHADFDAAKVDYAEDRDMSATERRAQAKEIEDLHSEVSHVKDAAATRETTRASMERKANELTEALESQLQEQCANTKSVQEVVAKERCRNTEMEEEFTTLKAQLTDAQEAAQQLSNVAKNAGAQLEVQETELQAERGKLTKLQADFDAAKVDYAEDQDMGVAELTSQAKEIEDLRSEVSHVKDAAASMEKKANQFTEALETQLQEQCANTESVKQVLNRERSRNTEMDEELTGLKAQLNDAREAAQQLSNVANNAGAQLEVRETELQAERGKLARLQADFDAAKVDYAEDRDMSATERRAQAKEIEDLHSEVSHVKDAAATRETTRASMERKANELTEALESQLREQCANTESVQEVVAKERCRNTEMEEEFTTLKAQLNDAQEAAQQLNHVAKNAGAQLEVQETELQAERSKLAKLQADYDAAKVDYAGDCDMGAAERRAQAKEIEDLHSEVSHVKDDAASMERKANQLTQTLETLQTEYEAERSEASAVPGLTSRFLALEADAQQRTEQLEKLIERCETRAEKFKTELIAEKERPPAVRDPDDLDQRIETAKRAARDELRAELDSDFRERLQDSDEVKAQAEREAKEEKSRSLGLAMELRALKAQVEEERKFTNSSVEKAKEDLVAERRRAATEVQSSQERAELLAKQIEEEKALLESQLKHTEEALKELEEKVSSTSELLQEATAEGNAQTLAATEEEVRTARDFQMQLKQEMREEADCARKATAELRASRSQLEEEKGSAAKKLAKLEKSRDETSRALESLREELARERRDAEATMVERAQNTNQIVEFKTLISRLQDKERASDRNLARSLADADTLTKEVARLQGQIQEQAAMEHGAHEEVANEVSAQAAAELDATRAELATTQAQLRVTKLEAGKKEADTMDVQRWRARAQRFRLRCLEAEAAQRWWDSGELQAVAVAKSEAAKWRCRAERFRKRCEAATAQARVVRGQVDTQERRVSEPQVFNMSMGDDDDEGAGSGSDWDFNVATNSKPSSPTSRGVTSPTSCGVTTTLKPTDEVKQPYPQIRQLQASFFNDQDDEDEDSESEEVPEEGENCSLDVADALQQGDAETENLKFTLTETLPENADTGNSSLDTRVAGTEELSKPSDQKAAQGRDHLELDATRQQAGEAFAGDIDRWDLEDDAHDGGHHEDDGMLQIAPGDGGFGDVDSRNMITEDVGAPNKAQQLAAEELQEEEGGWGDIDDGDMIAQDVELPNELQQLAVEELQEEGGWGDINVSGMIAKDADEPPMAQQLAAEELQEEESGWGDMDDGDITAKDADAPNMAQHLAAEELQEEESGWGDMDDGDMIAKDAEAPNMAQQLAVEALQEEESGWGDMDDGDMIATDAEAPNMAQQLAVEELQEEESGWGDMDDGDMIATDAEAPNMAQQLAAEELQEEESGWGDMDDGDMIATDAKAPNLAQQHAAKKLQEEESGLGDIDVGEASLEQVSQPNDGAVARAEETPAPSSELAEPVAKPLEDDNFDWDFDE